MNYENAVNLGDYIIRKANTTNLDPSLKIFCKGFVDSLPNEHTLKYALINAVSKTNMKTSDVNHEFCFFDQRLGPARTFIPNKINLKDTLMRELCDLSFPAGSSQILEEKPPIMKVTARPYSANETLFCMPFGEKDNQVRGNERMYSLIVKSEPNSNTLPNIDWISIIQNVEDRVNITNMELYVLNNILGPSLVTNNNLDIQPELKKQLIENSFFSSNYSPLIAFTLIPYSDNQSMIIKRFELELGNEQNMVDAAVTGLIETPDINWLRTIRTLEEIIQNKSKDIKEKLNFLDNTKTAVADLEKLIISYLLSHPAELNKKPFLKEDVLEELAHKVVKKIF